MRKGKEKVVAILLADIHLSLNPPIWRSAEPNWFEAMKRPLDEVTALQKTYGCPVICAGDIFDTWYSPPEVINFALEHLPHMYAIPGQHDLPLHNYEDIKKSAYWTLVKAGSVYNLPPKDLINISGSQLTVYGFPYGKKITPISVRSKFLRIAVVHEYLWVKGYSIPNAPQQNLYGRKQKNSNYDPMVYGDNHIGFTLGPETGKTSLFNCGSLMRRNSDQLKYEPRVGLLLKSGKVLSHYLDTSKDKHLLLDSTTNIGEAPNMRVLIQELEKLDGIDLDFSEVMIRYLKKNKIKKSIGNIIMKAMGL